MTTPLTSNDATQQVLEMLHAAFSQSKSANGQRAKRNPIVSEGSASVSKSPMKSLSTLDAYVSIREPVTPPVDSSPRRRAVKQKEEEEEGSPQTTRSSKRLQYNRASERQVHADVHWSSRQMRPRKHTRKRKHVKKTRSWSESSDEEDAAVVPPSPTPSMDTGSSSSEDLSPLVNRTRPLSLEDKEEEDAKSSDTVVSPKLTATVHYPQSVPAPPVHTINACPVNPTPQYIIETPFYVNPPAEDHALDFNADEMTLPIMNCDTATDAWLDSVICTDPVQER